MARKILTIDDSTIIRQIMIRQIKPRQTAIRQTVSCLLQVASFNLIATVLP